MSTIETLISEQEIHERVQAMAGEISRAMPHDFLIIALLRGSFVFAADLLRALHRTGAAPQVDFMTISSYSGEHSGALTVHRDVSSAVKGRDILLIDDILESGRTLFYARDEIMRRGASSIHIAVLLEKPGKRTMQVNAGFVGFTIPDRFVVGYGLDRDNYYRELPFIGVLKNEEQA